MKMKIKESAKCCESCPFLKANFGKPNPDTGYSDVQWYSKENMLRLWNDGLRHGEPMMCHSSDHNNKEYGGTYNVKKDKEKVCTGWLIVIYRHVKKYEKLLMESPHDTPNKIYKRYHKIAGKNAMTLRGITESAMMFALRRTELIGGLPIPYTVNEGREVNVQWECEISNNNSI